MFMFRAKKYLSELAKFRPDILEACQAAVNAADNGPATSSAFTMKHFSAKCPDESVDYAVMEKTADAVVVTISMPTGATSAPGPPCGRSPQPERRARVTFPSAA